MKKVKYLYSGDTTTVSLREKDGKEYTEVVLKKGCEVELCPTHPYTKTLMVRGLLVKLPETEGVLPQTQPTKKGAK